MPLVPKGVIVKIKGNILSSNSKLMARVIIFLLLSVSCSPPCVQSFDLSEDSWGPDSDFLLSTWFSLVQSHFCLSSDSWLFSLSLWEIWSLPCVGSVYASLTRPHASLDQTLNFPGASPACPDPQGTGSNKNRGSSALSRRTLLGHLWSRWPEPRAACVGPREGARTSLPLKSLGRGGHCSVVLRTSPTLPSRTNVASLEAERGALVFGWCIASQKPQNCFRSLWDREALTLFQHEEDFIIGDWVKEVSRQLPYIFSK